jgi:glycosyltransferase involved in cell wall biosynthesis
MQVTFVIPVYNERETLKPLVEGIVEHTAPHVCRILMIDDGSTDGSYDEMRAIQEHYPQLEIVRLRGNFGKSAALATGFALANGDIVITMDSDLQDDPKEIPRFLAKLDEGFDVVCGWKARRDDPWHKVYPSRVYNGYVAWLFKLPLHDVNCGFKAFRTEVVKQIQVYGEMHRLIPVLAHNMNYRVGEIPVDHHRRRYGVSKYGFERFTRGAADVLTMWFLSRHQYAPGHFYGKLGLYQFAIAFLSLCAGVIAGVVWQAHNATVTCIALAMLLAATGFITIGQGLLAELVLRHLVRIHPAMYAMDPEQMKSEKRPE